MIRFFRFVVVATLLALIATISAVVTMRFAIHGAEVEIPDFKGQSIAAARQHAAALGVNFSVDGQLYSTELPAGRVLTQSPAYGAVVRSGWQVRVTESLGPQRVAIPNVLGQPEQSASLAIRRLGLEVGEVARMPDAQAAPGTVVSQNPLPNANGVERPSISLLIAAAQPAPAPAWIMPDFIGQARSSAEATLARAGLPAAIERDALPQPDGSSAGAPGAVVRQSPAPGERVTLTTQILFDVAK